MDNNKMARVAKNFDTFAKVGDKIAVAAGIVCAVTAILTLIFGNKMFEAGTVTLDLDFVKFHLSSDTYVNMQFMKFYVCAATLGGSVLCFLLSYICKVLGVCKTTACKIKNSGILDPAISQRGKVIVVDADLALELMKASNNAIRRIKNKR